jgi:uncharacterized protein (TIGR02145 family)
MIKYFNLILFLIYSFSSVSQTNVKPVYGTFSDFRDKKAYKTVTIGNQTWLGYNLNFSMANSWCYNDSAENCKLYGRLYTQDAARTACPAGWHLPSADEWLVLINRIGGKQVAGRYMKESGTEHWKTPNDNADNSSGLKVLPAGYRDAYGEAFYRLGEEAVYWSSTKLNDSAIYSWSFFLHYNSGAAFTETITLSNHKNGYSVRCLKNPIITPKQ